MTSLCYFVCVRVCIVIVVRVHRLKAFKLLIFRAK